MQKKRNGRDPEEIRKKSSKGHTYKRKPDEKKRRRMKQVRVEERMIDRKRLQYFIGLGKGIHYSPPL